MLTWDLVVIDGPNLYNFVARSLSRRDDRDMESYVKHWLDFDRLMAASTDQYAPSLGTVIFHSGKQLGSNKTVQLKDQDVLSFWARQGSNPFCSTEFVDVPGAQDEGFRGECPKCREPVVLGEKREKGVDTSITSYLWETFDRWGSACIVSGDGDFVPPARSLKRRGKRVFCAVEPGSSRKDLVQVCTSHVELNVDFLTRDLATREVLKPEGILDQCILDLRGRFPGLRVHQDEAGVYAGQGPRFFVRVTIPSVTREDGKAEDAKMVRRLSPFRWSTVQAETHRNGSDLVDYTLGFYPGEHAYTQDQLIVEGIGRHGEQFARSGWAQALPRTG